MLVKVNSASPSYSCALRKNSTFDLDAIHNKVLEMQADMVDKNETATDMVEAFEQEARRLEALRLLAAKDDLIHAQ